MTDLVAILLPVCGLDEHHAAPTCACCPTNIRPNNCEILHKSYVGLRSYWACSPSLPSSFRSYWACIPKLLGLSYIQPIFIGPILFIWRYPK